MTCPICKRSWCPCHGPNCPYCTAAKKVTEANQQNNNINVSDQSKIVKQ